MARVLLVDDDPSVLFALQSLLQSAGHEAVLADSGAEALAQLEGVDAVITDYSMQGMNGVQLLQAVRERDDSPPVILLTAHGSERLAVQAIKAGAYEYLSKPADSDELLLMLERALEARALRIQNRQLTAEKALGHTMIANSVAMRQLLDQVARVGPKDITVLIRGETGTGKELIASLVHAHSKRSAQPLVRFNCSAIPGELAEAGDTAAWSEPRREGQRARCRLHQPGSRAGGARGTLPDGLILSIGGGRIAGASAASTSRRHSCARCRIRASIWHALR